MITTQYSVSVFVLCIVSAISNVSVSSVGSDNVNCPRILQTARQLSTVVRLASEIQSGNLDVESQCGKDMDTYLKSLKQNSIIHPRRLKRQTEDSAVDKELMDAAIVLQALQGDNSDSLGVGAGEDLNIPVVEFDQVLRQISVGRDSDEMKQLGEVMTMVDMYRIKAQNASITANRALHTIRKMTAFVRSVAEQLSTRIDENANSSFQANQRLSQMETAMHQLAASTRQFNTAVTSLTKKLYDRGLLTPDSLSDNTEDEERQQMPLSADVQPLGVLRSLDDPCSDNKQKEACVDLKQMFGKLMDESVEQKEKDRMMHVRMKGMILDVAGLKEKIDNITRENIELRQQVDRLQLKVDNSCCAVNNDSEVQSTTMSDITESTPEDNEISTMGGMTTTTGVITTNDIDYTTQTTSTGPTTETDYTGSTEDSQEGKSTEQESSATSDITEFTTTTIASFSGNKALPGYNYDPPAKENRLQLSEPQVTSDDDETTEYSTETPATDSSTEYTTETSTTDSSTEYTTETSSIDRSTTAEVTPTTPQETDSTVTPTTTETSVNFTKTSTIESLEITTEESNEEDENEGELGYNYNPPELEDQLTLPRPNRPANGVSIQQPISNNSPQTYQQNQNQPDQNQNQYQPNQNQNQYQANQNRNQYQPNQKQNPYQPNQNPNQYQPNQNQYQPQENQYQTNQNQYQPNQNDYQPNQNQNQHQSGHNQNQYQPDHNQNQYQPNQNQYQPQENQYQPNQNQYQPQENQYQPNQNQYQPNQNQHQTQENQNQPNQNQYQPQENQYRPKQDQYQPQENQYQPNQNQYQPQENQNQYQPNQNQYQPKENQNQYQPQENQNQYQPQENQSQYQPNQNQYQPQENQNQYQPQENQNQYQPNQNQFQPQENQYRTNQNQFEPNQNQNWNNQQFSRGQAVNDQSADSWRSGSEFGTDVRTPPPPRNQQQVVVWLDDTPGEDNAAQERTRTRNYSSQNNPLNRYYNQRQSDLSAAPSEQNPRTTSTNTQQGGQGVASFRSTGQQETAASRSKCRGSPSNPLPGLDVWCRNNCPNYCPRSHCICDE